MAGRNEATENWNTKSEQQIHDCESDTHVTVHREQNESYLWQGKVLKQEYHIILAILPFFSPQFTKDAKHAFTKDGGHTVDM